MLARRIKLVWCDFGFVWLGWLTGWLNRGLCELPPSIHHTPFALPGIFVQNNFFDLFYIGIGKMAHRTIEGGGWYGNSEHFATVGSILQHFATLLQHFATTLQPFAALGSILQQLGSESVVFS